MMKFSTIIPLFSVVLLASCVSLGKYEDLQSSHNRTKKELNVARQELQAMRDENAELVRQNQAMSLGLGEMTAAKNDADDKVKTLTTSLESLQHRYDTTMESYVRLLSGKNRDLSKANDLLASRNKELAEKEAAFKKREADLKAQQKELQLKQKAAEDALAAKEAEIEQVRQTVTNALVGFTDKGLQIETRDGKVYVSMASKLMFASGSWTVSKDGIEAIKELAKVLEENTDLNVMVEGHTDDVAFKGSTAVKDNWDLSVMRATAIVKLLLQYGETIDPVRVEAAGHGPYMPKADNATAEGKAQNRRTEIIITPKITELLDMIEK